MAAKLGAESVLGADIDGEALENARENAALNDITKIEFIQGSIDKVSSRRFDLILANINLNVLKNLPAALFECLKSDGKLILSGILHSDVPEIDRIYSESGFRPEKKEEAGEWAGLLYTV